MSKGTPRLVWLIASLLIGLSLTACMPSSSTKSQLPVFPLGQLPAEIQAAPPIVREAYQFAAANPDILKEIPCYCGCGSIGHLSNYDCYVSEVNADGELIFDPHGLGCSICVDITRDVMRYLDEGKSLSEIQASIQVNYAKYGPPTTP